MAESEDLSKLRLPDLFERVHKGIDRMGTTPVDCTNSCADGPCNCSGRWRFANPASEPAFAALRELGRRTMTEKGEPR